MEVITLGKRHLALVKAHALEYKDVDVEVVASDKSVRVCSEQPLSGFGYCCPYDKLPCKRYDYVLDNGACFTYDRNGRLRFVCKRCVLPTGFSLIKQMSSEQLKQDGSEGERGSMSLLVPTERL
jgi:hypothetical protein